MNDDLNATREVLTAHGVTGYSLAWMDVKLVLVRVRANDLFGLFGAKAAANWLALQYGITAHVEEN